MEFMICLKSMVVYHLHGQTGWSMVWANGMHHSGLVNFILESRSPFVQITSIYQKMTAKAWNWYQRTGFEEMEQILFWNISFGKKGKPFQMFCCSWKFSTGKTQKVVFHVLSNRIFQKLFVNCKQPILLLKYQY